MKVFIINNPQDKEILMLFENYQHIYQNLYLNYMIIEKKIF